MNVSENSLLRNVIYINEIAEQTKETLLKKLGNFAVNNGFSKPSFKQALIDREEQYPTALAFEHVSIAIPHTDMEHVIKPGIVFCKLEHPVKFIHMATEDQIVDVEIVIMLLIKENADQVRVLQALMEICADEKDAAFLKKVSNESEAESLLVPAIMKVIRKEEQA